ncbi:hypothetical protein KGA66_10215 [Actinocrinis puniceicyclus]|uniref:Uncharacterized protein n=1 Tax=Actinocrinis puniceicyclus TaxID=977794 RepID=A0A8J7WJG3_9ACTN|nr:hypothetical protein [Actinocrinis puniceicyclus]MBS2963421.1 hypothetical protein [Actinocrinis puniceicyclus]
MANGDEAASTAAGSTSGAGDATHPPMAISRLLMTAYVAVTGVVAAFGGAAALVGPFADGGKTATVMTVVLMAVLVLLVAGVLALARVVHIRITGSIGVLAGVVAVALALGGTIGFLLRPSNSGGHAGPPSASQTPVGSVSTAPTATSTSAVASASASASTGPCIKPLTITSPADGAKIVGHAGVALTIAACGLTADETGWLFDYQGGTYGLDNGGPVVTANGTIPFVDTPVGETGDVDQEVTLTLVLADSACSSALSKIDFDNNPPSTLPAGCRIESRVSVSETY